MTRTGRILVELLAPPFVASALFALIGAVVTGGWESLAALPLVTFFAFLFAGIPSLIFTLLLEVAYARGLAPSSWHAVRLAALAGLLSGLMVTLWFHPWAEPKPWGGLAIFAALGAATGAIVGLIVRSRSRGPPPSAPRDREPVGVTGPPGVARGEEETPREPPVTGS